MADVRMIDIDGELWNIKDRDAREKVATIEENISTQNLKDVQITMKDGYTCDLIRITNHYKVGKIHFAFIRIQNLSGAGVGTTRTVHIASTDLIPVSYTTFIARDYNAPATIRCSLGVDGSIILDESNGIKDGDNMILGEIIFAEP